MSSDKQNKTGLVGKERHHQSSEYSPVFGRDRQRMQGDCGKYQGAGDVHRVTPGLGVAQRVQVDLEGMRRFIERAGVSGVR